MPLAPPTPHLVSSLGIHFVLGSRSSDNQQPRFTQGPIPPSLNPGTYVVSVYYSLINKGHVETKRSGRSGIVVKQALETKLTS